MNQKLLAFAAVMFFIAHSCIELYEPEVNTNKSYLVVEGLITDDPGPHLIKLSRTKIFGDFSGKSYESNAQLAVADSENNIVYLEERLPGHYYTPAGFKSQIGKTYILHIETENGDVYESGPQKMPEPVKIDSIYAEFGMHIFFIESKVSYTLYKRDVLGVNLFIDVSHDEIQHPKFRINAVLMLQYVFVKDADDSFDEIDDTEPDEEFCWIKRKVSDLFEAEIIKNINNKNTTRQRVAFIPAESRSMRHLGFPLEERSDAEGNTDIAEFYEPRILKSVYTLNDEAYYFYREKNKQLGDAGSFFDPIDPQLLSNIKNVYDPFDVVLGFFEVSAVSKSSLRILIPPEQHQRIRIVEIDCQDYVSNYGCVIGEEPEWWL